MKNDINSDFVLRSLNVDGGDALSSFKKQGKHLDWEWILKFSEKYKICGLLINNLDRVGITEELPQEVQKRIDSIKEEASQRTDHAQLTLKQLSEALNSERIPFMVLKGSIFAHEVYDDPSIRPFHDIDLLVPKQLLNRVEKILISIGYSFYCPPIQDIRGFIPLGKIPRSRGRNTFSEDVTRDLFDRYNFHYPFVLPPDDSRLPIDLHWHLSSPDVLKIEPESLWDHTREKIIENVLVKTLNLETTILFLAMKIAIEGPIELLSLCDLIRYLETYKRKYDLPYLWSTADKWRAKNYLQFSLKLAEKLFNFDSSAHFGRCCKKNLISDNCFHFATNPSLIFEPIDKDGIFKYCFFKLKSFIRRVLWDISIRRAPRRGVRSLVRIAAVFKEKEV